MRSWVDSVNKENKRELVKLSTSIARALTTQIASL